MNEKDAKFYQGVALWFVGVFFIGIAVVAGASSMVGIAASGPFMLAGAIRICEGMWGS